MFFSTISDAIFAFLIARAAGAERVSKSFLSFSTNNFSAVFLFEQCITPKHSLAAINGAHRTDNVVKFPTSISDGEKEIEAILFASSEPLDEENIETKISKKINVKKALENLKKHYENRGINLICISNKWSFRTSEKLSYLMSKQKTVEKKRMGRFPIRNVYHKVCLECARRFLFFSFSCSQN